MKIGTIFRFLAILFLSAAAVCFLIGFAGEAARYNLIAAGALCVGGGLLLLSEKKKDQ